MSETFCPECGERHESSARFCENCGHRFAETPPDQASTRTQEQAKSVEPIPPAGQSGGTAGWWKSPWPWVAAIVAIVAIAVVLVVVLGEGDDDSGYAEEVASVITPVAQANDALSDELSGLEEGGGVTPVRGEAKAGLNSVRDAQSAVELIEVPESERELRRAVDEAMSAQVRYLSAVARAVRQPSETTAAELGPRADAARAAWSAVSASIAGAGGRISGSDNLATWARAEAGAPDGQPSPDEGAGEEPAPPPVAEVLSCGGFEGIFDVFAAGVDCDTALRIAAAQVNSGAPGEGFTCTQVPPLSGMEGAVGYDCSRGADAEGGVEAGVSFDVFE